MLQVPQKRLVCDPNDLSAGLTVIDEGLDLVESGLTHGEIRKIFQEIVKPDLCDCANLVLGDLCFNLAFDACAIHQRRVSSLLARWSQRVGQRLHLRIFILSIAHRHDVIALNSALFENSFDSFCCPPARSERQSDGFTVIGNENKLAHRSAPSVSGIFRIRHQLPKNLKVVAWAFSQDRQQTETECWFVEYVFFFVVFSSYTTNQLSEEPLPAFLCGNILTF